MIDTQTLQDEFCELVRVDSLSGEEAAIADILEEKLREIGLSVTRDNACEPLGSQCGNVIGILPATAPSLPTIMLNAHMDTVRPGKGICPVCERDTIRSAGDTILGADDKTGIAIILAGLRQLAAQNIPHGELQVVFTIAEETGLNGAKYMDYALVNPRFALVFDGGRTPGTMTVAAPSAYKMTWRIHGRAAHAGLCPENGINAVQLASQAIAEMKLGRIDAKTTANIGVISGGEARNIVPPLCEIKGEARSHDEARLEAQIEHMRACLRNAVASVEGAELEEEMETSYKSFHLTEDDEVVQFACTAAKNIGLTPELKIGGGGSDANIFNEKGIPALILANGAENVHTVDECASVNSMAQGVQWLLEIIRVAR